MKAEIEEAIKSARSKNKGKIAPASDIYEAIFKAGIREVVEWVNSERKNQNPSVWHSRWQAKLRDWGIE